MERPAISSTGFRSAFVLILVLAVSLLFLAVAWPFLKPLLLGALLVSLCRPLYLWMMRLVRGRRSLAAILTLLLLLVIVAGPFSAFVGVVVSQAVNVSEHAIPWVQQHFGSASRLNLHDWLVQRFPALAPHVPDQAQILEAFGRAAKATGGFLVVGATQFTAGTAGFLLDLFVMIYAMFFFFRDGKKIIEKIFYYMPLDHDDEVVLLERLTSVTRRRSRERSSSASSRERSPVLPFGWRESTAFRKLEAPLYVIQPPNVNMAGTKMVSFVTNYSSAEGYSRTDPHGGAQRDQSARHIPPARASLLAGRISFRKAPSRV
jgi:hypothetical protein